MRIDQNTVEPDSSNVLICLLFILVCLPACLPVSIFPLCSPFLSFPSLMDRNYLFCFPFSWLHRSFHFKPLSCGVLPYCICLSCLVRTLEKKKYSSFFLIQSFQKSFNELSCSVPLQRLRWSERIITSRSFLAREIRTS